MQSRADGGLKSTWRQNAHFSNGPGWNQLSQRISGHTAMPKSPWLFSGSGVASFQSVLSAQVCDLVLLRGLYYTQTSLNKIKSDYQSHSVFCLGCGGAGRTRAYGSVTRRIFERVFWNWRLNLQRDGETLSSAAQTRGAGLFQQWVGLCPQAGRFQLLDFQLMELILYSLHDIYCNVIQCAILHLNYIFCKSSLKLSK